MGRSTAGSVEVARSLTCVRLLALGGDAVKTLECLNNCEDLLASLDRKLQLVRDRVHSVARKYSNGFYLWGEGGTSKSYTVEETLEPLCPYKLTNSRLTGKGLFTLL